MTWFERLDEGRDKLTDGWAMAGGPEFWAAHLIAQGFGEDDDDLVYEAFKVREPEVTALYERLTSPDTWPVFTVGLAGGARLHVVYRNYAQDEGVDYLFDSGDGIENAVRIAGLEGEFAGPGAAWSEIVSFGREELLLLAPMCGEDEPGRDVIKKLTEATGSRDLAELLIDDHPMWDAPTWRRDGDALVCDGELSPRNPRADNTLPRRALDQITAALR